MTTIPPTGAARSYDDIQRDIALKEAMETFSEAMKKTPGVMMRLPDPPPRTVEIAGRTIVLAHVIAVGSILSGCGPHGCDLLAIDTTAGRLEIVSAGPKFEAQRQRLIDALNGMEG